MISFYGMRYQDAMSLHLRTFWFMNTCIGRIMAERDLRAMDVGMSISSDAKGIQNFKQHLTIELGDVMVMKADPIASAVRDEAGFQKLKAMTMK